MPLTVPVPLALGRFKQLPQRSTEVWQGGLVRMPMWIDDPVNPDEAPPYRPTGVIWVSLGAGLMHVDLAKSEDAATPAFALATLLEFGLKFNRSGMGRPSRIEVADPALRDVLADMLVPLNTTVDLVPALPAVAQALQSFEEHSGGGSRIAGLLESPGVTHDDLRGFADAAALFYTARPWVHLANEDLIVVDAPKSPAALRHVSVLGHGGQEFGLAFYGSRAELERLLDPVSVNRRPPTHAYGVTFGPKHELPFADVDAWDDLALPVASEQAYPLAADVFVDGRAQRPTRAELHHMEALLRALAATTEEELDSGRWKKIVVTAGGPRTLTFTLPLLLEAESGGAPAGRAGARGSGTEPMLARIQSFLAGQEFGSIDDVNAALGNAMNTRRFDGDAEPATDATPLARAQDLAWRAMEASGRLRIKLARQALALSRDCADAWLVLAGAVSDPASARPLFEEAVSAGARAIGADRFAELSGEFWGHIETRPYMRARLELAQTFVAVGRMDDALEHFREMLRLNPNDNQGIRYLLVPLLLEVGHDREATEWLDRYPDDAGATLAYARVLLRFRAEGDSAASRALLAAAVGTNRFVVDHLLERTEAPIIPYESFALGSPEEASAAGDDLLPAFRKTVGALAWLATEGPKAQVAARQKATRKRRSGTRGGGKKGHAGRP